MLLVANFLWGLSFPVIKAIVLLHAQLLPTAGTWFSTVYTVAPRFVLAVGLLLAFRPSLVRVTSGEMKQGVIIGFFAAIGMLLQNDGLQFTEASTSAFLTQFYAIMIPVYVALRGRRNPGVRIWLCCALVLAGVAILGRFDWHTLRFGRGEAETLLSSVFFMGQILWLEKKEFSANRPAQLTLVLFATEALVFCVLAAFAAPDIDAILRPWMSIPWVGLTLILTLFCTIGAFVLMNTWQPKITATEAGLIYCIEPIFAAIMAGFLPAWFSAWAGVAYANEQLTWTLLFGGGLITIANILIQIRPAASRR